MLGTKPTSSVRTSTYLFGDKLSLCNAGCPRTQSMSSARTNTIYLFIKRLSLTLALGLTDLARPAPGTCPPLPSYCWGYKRVSQCSTFYIFWGLGFGHACTQSEIPPHPHSSSLDLNNSCLFFKSVKCHNQSLP